VVHTAKEKIGQIRKCIVRPKWSKSKKSNNHENISNFETQLYRMVPEMSLRAKIQLECKLQLAIRFKGNGHLTHSGRLRALSPKFN